MLSYKGKESFVHTIKILYSCRKAFICYDKVQSVMHSEIPSMFHTVIIWWPEWKKDIIPFVRRICYRRIHTTEYITPKVSWRWYKCMPIIVSYIYIVKNQREISQKFLCFLMIFLYSFNLSFVEYRCYFSCWILLNLWLTERDNAYSDIL